MLIEKSINAETLKQVADVNGYNAELIAEGEHYDCLGNICYLTREQFILGLPVIYTMATNNYSEMNRFAIFKVREIATIKCNNCEY